MITFTRKQLYDLMWNEHKSLKKIAEHYDVHYADLVNAVKENDVPKPANSFWTKLYLNMDISDETILPFTESNDEKEIRVRNTSEVVKKERAKEKKETVLPKKQKEGLKTEEIVERSPEQEKMKMHSVIRQYKKSLNDYEVYLKDEKWNANHPWNRKRVRYAKQPISFFKEPVSEEGKERAFSILNLIFVEAEKRGAAINDDLSVSFDGHSVKVSFVESRDSIPHQLSKEEARKLAEYRDEVKRRSWATKPKINKYDHPFNGKLRINISYKVWLKDEKTCRLEDKIDEIVDAIYAEAGRLKEVQEAKIAEELRRKKEREEREAAAKRIEKEIMMIRALLKKAEDLRTAEMIRSYVKYMLENDEMSDELAEWALDKADWFDPAVDHDDRILGTKDHSKDLDEIKEEKLRYRDSHWFRF